MTADPGRSGGEVTGRYHRHPSLEVCETFACIYPGTTDATPVLVLVLDLAGAREQIARAKEAAAVYEEHHAAAVHAPIGDPLRKVHTALGDLTHEVLTLLVALASQERGE